MERVKKITALVVILGLTLSVSAENEPVILEAESGVVGEEFNSLTDGDVNYVTISTNGTAAYPERAGRVITFEITFPDSGTYDLYCWVRIGPDGADDDSYFYGNGFGEKDTI